MSDTVNAPSAEARRPAPQPVSPRLRWLSEMVWRIGLLVAAFLAIGWAMWQLKVVVLPVFAALLLSSVLAGPVVALERRGWPTALATSVVLVGGLAALIGVMVLVIPPAIEGVSGLDDATASATEDVENWLVDGPLGLERSDVEGYTSDPAGQVIDLVEESSLSVSSGVQLIGETLAGILLSFVLTFFFLKDGRRFQRWTLGHLRGGPREAVRAASARAWSTFGGYLRGAAVLGALEGAIIGVTMWLVGAPLALPLAVITFAAAFFPIVGAVVAGSLAVLVTFASAGGVPALIVMAVAVLVQQLDSDLLGPAIYGRTLDIHPVVVLLSLTAGAVLGGIAGAFVAVPVTAALIGAGQELWNARDIVDEIGPAPEPSPPRATKAEADEHRR